MMCFELSYIVGCYVSDEGDARLLEEVVFDRLYWDRFDDAAKKIADAEALVINGVSH